MGEILVTGGARFIGTHTCIALLQAGYSVVILDNLCNAKQESLLHLQEITGKSIPFYHMDIRNADGLRQIFQTHHISAVLHFAGLKAVGESVQQPLRYYQNNIGGMMTLLEELQKTDCRTLIFSSSATVYGTQHTAPYAETVTPLSASNPYGETKIISEQLLQDLCQADSDWHITALRYFNPIGAHESGLLGEEPHGIPSNIAPYLALVASGQLPYFRVYGNDYDTQTVLVSGTMSMSWIWQKDTFLPCNTACSTLASRYSTWEQAAVAVCWNWQTCMKPSVESQFP